jgi:DNA-binding NtrC family response regulator
MAEKILIVDDEPDMLKLLSMILIRNTANFK